jgi:hypothetical protein
MSFHVGGHKPKQVDEPPKILVKRRLWVLGVGVFMTLGGLYRASHARLIGENYFGQPVHSTDLMMVGVLCMLCALIPTSWLAAAAGLGRRSGRKRERPTRG